MGRGSGLARRMEGLSAGPPSSCGVLSNYQVPQDAFITLGALGRLSPGNPVHTQYPVLFIPPADEPGKSPSVLSTLVCQRCGAFLFTAPPAQPTCQCGEPVKPPPFIECRRKEVLSVDPSGSGILDGRLDGSGGWVIYRPSSSRPRLYTLERLHAGGEVVVRSRTSNGIEKSMVKQDGSCSCGENGCIHQQLIETIRQWDPFAPRQETRNRYHFSACLVVDMDWDRKSRLRSKIKLPSFGSGLDPAIARMRSIIDKPESPEHYYPWGLLRRAPDDLKNDYAVLCHRITISLSTKPNHYHIRYWLALWREVLRGVGWAEPVLPEEPIFCAQCQRFTDLSGVCPHCLPKMLEGYQSAWTKLPSHGLYLNDVVKMPAGSVEERLLQAAAYRVNLAVQENSAIQWSTAVRVWNYLVGENDLRLSPNPLRCQHCQRILDGDGLCPKCDRSEQPSEELRLARHWLRHMSDLELPMAEEITSLDLLGNEDGPRLVRMGFSTTQRPLIVRIEDGRVRPVSRLVSLIDGSLQPTVLKDELAKTCDRLAALSRFVVSESAGMR